MQGQYSSLELGHSQWRIFVEDGRTCPCAYPWCRAGRGTLCTRECTRLVVHLFGVIRHSHTSHAFRGGNFQAPTNATCASPHTCAEDVHNHPFDAPFISKQQRVSPFLGKLASKGNLEHLSPLCGPSSVQSMLQRSRTRHRVRGDESVSESCVAVAEVLKLLLQSLYGAYVTGLDSPDLFPPQTAHSMYRVLLNFAMGDSRRRGGHGAPQRAVTARVWFVVDAQWRLNLQHGPSRISSCADT